MKRSMIFKKCLLFVSTLAVAATVQAKAAPAGTGKGKPVVTTASTPENAADDTAGPHVKSAPAKTMKFHFQNAEITDIIASYAKASGQKFIVDPSVRGKASILNPKETSLTEAFALLSSALAVNNFAISEQGDTMVVQSARNTQRSLVPLYKELPDLKPERMATMVFELKYASAEEVNKRLRILPSRDGELTPYEPSNKIFVTDWVSNIHRIAAIINEIDQPAQDTTRALPAKAKEKADTDTKN